MKTLVTNHLIVKPSLIAGYGVFAAKAFEEHEIIEECHAILSEGKDPSLKNYYFRSGEKVILSTGYGLLYNHSDIPNAKCYYNEQQNRLVFQALRPIQENEEIVVFYSQTWFSDRNIAIKKMASWRKLLRFSLGAPLRTVLILCTLFLANQWLHLLIGR